MKDLLSDNQYRKLRHVLMWNGEWERALLTDTASMSYEKMLNHEKGTQWYAYKAVKDCEELGLDAELLLSQTLIGHAWEYRNKVLPRRREKTRKELKAEGII